MKLSDIIALAKQGFTPADIREFMATDQQQEKGKDPEEKEKDPGEDPEEKEEPETQPAKKKDDQGKEETPDYKKLYEEEKAKRQKEAAKKDMGLDPEKSIEETLIDIAKMYV